MAQLEFKPSEIVDELISTFDKADPFEREPNTDPSRYRAYDAGDAAYDVLIDRGIRHGEVDIFKTMRIQANLAKICARAIPNYKRIMVMRNKLRDELNIFP